MSTYPRTILGFIVIVFAVTATIVALQVTQADAETCFPVDANNVYCVDVDKDHVGVAHRVLVQPRTQTEVAVTRVCDGEEGLVLTATLNSQPSHHFVPGKWLCVGHGAIEAAAAKAVATAPAAVETVATPVEEVAATQAAESAASSADEAAENESVCIRTDQHHEICLILLTDHTYAGVSVLNNDTTREEIRHGVLVARDCEGERDAEQGLDLAAVVEYSPVDLSIPTDHFC